VKTFWRALWEGFASCATLGMYPRVRSPYHFDPKQTDEEAIASDWAAVGGDMRRAIDTVKREENQARQRMKKERERNVN